MASAPSVAHGTLADHYRLPIRSWRWPLLGVWTGVVCIFGRIRFRRWCKSCGIELMRDWHSYTRQLFNARYQEEVQDKRGFYGIMDTSLELQRFLKDLRVVCSDESKKRMDEITDVGGDSDQSSYYPASKSNAGAKAPNGKSTEKSAKARDKELIENLPDCQMSQVSRSHNDDEYQDGAENKRLSVARNANVPPRKHKARSTSVQTQTESSPPVKRSKPNSVKGGAGAVGRASASKATAREARTELVNPDEYAEGVMRTLTGRVL